MKTPPPTWVSNFYKYSLLGVAVLQIAVYFVVVLGRIRYPFELEWNEGGAVDQVRRILSGQRLYVSPTLEYASFVYTPLYFYLSAAVSKIAGIGFTPLRLVSFISSLGSFSVILLIVRRETGSSFSGILACCLFAATFKAGGAWFDVARPDSLFLFFLLAALYVLRFGASATSYAIAGTLLALSFLTKQTALIAALPLMAYAVVLKRRHSVFFIGTALAIVGVSTVLLNHMHGGWYKYYVLDMAGRHSRDPVFLAGFWTKDIMAPLAIALSMALFYVFAQLEDSAGKDWLLYLFAVVAMLGLSWIAKSTLGGYDNVLLPAYAIISIFFGLAVQAILQFLSAGAANRRRLLEIYVYLICVIQFVSLMYNPLHQIPTARDLEAGTELVDRLRQVQGDVLVPYHSYLTALAGKKCHAHWAAVSELLGVYGGGETEAGTAFVEQMKQAIRDRRFGAIVLDPYPAPMRADLVQYIEEYYASQGPVFDSKAVFWPVTGMLTRPDVIYTPKVEGTY